GAIPRWRRPDRADRVAMAGRGPGVAADRAHPLARARTPRWRAGRSRVREEERDAGDRDEGDARAAQGRRARGRLARGRRGRNAGARDEKENGMKARNALLSIVASAALVSSLASPARAQTLKPQDVLRIAQIEEVTNFDPALMNTQDMGLLINNIYECL